MTTRSGLDRCPDENELTLLGEGALDDADRSAIEAHLEGCPRCAQLVTELARMMAPQPGVPARYRLVRQLGAGGMGVVWEAEDTQLGRRVAVKVIAPEHADSPAQRARFLREARALAQLRHPNVVAVHDAGEHGQELYLVLELVGGRTARAWLAARPRATLETFAVWRQVAAGLGAVHRAGLVHRDVKPDNVLVDDAGHAWLADFGLATASEAGDVSLTSTGAVVGTPLYMAPEQLRGEPATAQSDQFALCASIWEALAGARPFAGTRVASLAVEMTRPPVLPRGDRALQRVFSVLVRGLDPDPGGRWPGIEAMSAALDAAVGAGPRRRGARVAVMVALSASLVAASAWLVGSVSRGPAGVAPAPVAVAAPGTILQAPPSPASSLAVDATPAAAPPPRLSPVPEAAEVRSPGPRRVVQQASGIAERAATGRVAMVRPAAQPASDRLTSSDTYKRASQELERGRPTACVEILAAAPTPPPDLVESIEMLRSKCLVRAGDCAGGDAVITRYGTTAGWTPERIAKTIDAVDILGCEIDAPPRDRWPVRARAQLEHAISRNERCIPLLNKIRDLGIQFPSQAEILALELICRARDGDCAGARALIPRVLIPTGLDAEAARRAVEREEQAFVLVYPQCR